MPIALEYAMPGAAQSADVQRYLRCTLQQHIDDDHDHHGFVLHLDGTDTGSVWTRWTREHQPTTLIVLPDCDAVGPPPDHDACCEFANHPGAHTHDIADPVFLDWPTRLLAPTLALSDRLSLGADVAQNT